MEKKAHQRIIREQKATESDLQADMFSDFWRDIDTDIKKSVVREVDYGTAKNIIEEYEWLQCMPAISWYYYGIFFDDICAGVVVYGQEYGENLGLWDKYDYTGKIILLARGACVHWAHPHSASKLISQSIKLLPEKYKVITATVDELAGERK